MGTNGDHNVAWSHNHDHCILILGEISTVTLGQVTVGNTRHFEIASVGKFVVLLTGPHTPLENYEAVFLTKITIGMHAMTIGVHVITTGVHVIKIGVQCHDNSCACQLAHLLISTLPICNCGNVFFKVA